MSEIPSKQWCQSHRGIIGRAFLYNCYGSDLSMKSGAKVPKGTIVFGKTGFVVAEDDAPGFLAKSISDFKPNRECLWNGFRLPCLAHPDAPETSTSNRKLKPFLYVVAAVVDAKTERKANEENMPVINYPGYKGLLNLEIYHFKSQRSAGRAELLPKSAPEIGFCDSGIEGQCGRGFVNRYERDPRLREECIRHFKPMCCVCGFDFGEEFGSIADGYIHVHHLTPLGDGKGERSVDPRKDLRPICPNCHAVAHLKSPPLTVDELKALRAHGRGD